MRKGQTRRKWTRSVAFCWWKVRFHPPSALSRARDNSVVISVIPWGLPFPELLETTSTTWVCFSCNGWAIPPHSLKQNESFPSLDHCQFSYRCPHPSCSPCDIVPSPKITPILSRDNVFSSKAEGTMIGWNIQVLLFWLIHPKSFKSCRVPTRTSARNFTPHCPGGILSLLVNCFFLCTKKSPGNNSLSVWKVQKQRKMGKHWKRKDKLLPWVNQSRLVCTKPTPPHRDDVRNWCESSSPVRKKITLHFQTHIFKGATRRRNESDDRNRARKHEDHPKQTIWAWNVRQILPGGINQSSLSSSVHMSERVPQLRPCVPLHTDLKSSVLYRKEINSINTPRGFQPGSNWPADSGHWE